MIGVFDFIAPFSLCVSFKVLTLVRKIVDWSGYGKIGRHPIIAGQVVWLRIPVWLREEVWLREILKRWIVRVIVTSRPSRSTVSNCAPNRASK
jgi:hypothetical protein